jgi:AcrR family transcriptional regulator
VPRTEEANQQIREDRRQQILAAALKIFARKGLTATRIADIAAATGISQGLIYRYFASKEAVFASLVEGTFQLTLLLAQQAEALTASPLGKLRWLTAQLLPYQYEQPEGVLLLIHAMVNEAVPAGIKQTSLEYSAKVQAIVQNIIAQGQAAGEINRGNPEQLMILFLATFQGLATAATFLDRQSYCFPEVDTLLQFLRP